MKICISTAAWLLALGHVFGQCQDLFISEYVEGWSNNKALEIYNPTNAAIDLSDYRLERYSNGATTAQDNQKVDLSGTVAPYDVVVVVLDKQDPDGVDFEAPVWDELAELADLWLCPVYEENNMMYYNGNDAIVLRKISTNTPLDIFGKVGEDPGTTGWAEMTQNHTLARKSAVEGGDTDALDDYLVVDEWQGLIWSNDSLNYTLDQVFSNLGFHDCACSPAEIEGCTNPNAMNWNPNATLDDGSCNYTDELWVLNETPPSLGRIDLTSFEYQELLSFDNVGYATDLAIQDETAIVVLQNRVVKVDLMSGQILADTELLGAQETVLLEDGTVVVTRGGLDDAWQPLELTSHLVWLDGDDLVLEGELLPTEGPTLPSQEVTVVDGKVYIAVNNAWSWGQEVGRLGCWDPEAGTYSEWDLGESAKNPVALHALDGQLFTVNNGDWSSTSVSRTSLSDMSVVETVVLDGVSVGSNASSIVENKLAVQISGENGLRLFDGSNMAWEEGEILNAGAPSAYSFSAHPSLGWTFSGVTDYVTFGEVQIRATDGSLIASVQVGISPGSLAFRESAIPVTAGCNDSNACNFNPGATEDDGSCDYSCAGCTDPSSSNYDEFATVEDGSCIYFETSCAFIGSEGWADLGVGLFAEVEVLTHEFGVVGNGALVLSLPEVIEEPATGNPFAVMAWNDLTVSGLPNGFVMSNAPSSMDPGTQVCLTYSGTPVEEGVFDIVVSGDLILSVFGQPYPVGSFESSVPMSITPNVSGIVGCTYPNATNYLSYATIESGTCTFEGCMDPEANNFQIFALSEDGTCEYDACASACPSDVDGDGSVGTGDLLSLLASFGLVCE